MKITLKGGHFDGREIDAPDGCNRINIPILGDHPETGRYGYYPAFYDSRTGDFRGYGGTDTPTDLLAETMQWIWRDFGIEPGNRWAAFTLDELIQLTAFIEHSKAEPWWNPGQPTLRLDAEIQAELERRKAGTRPPE